MLFEAWLGITAFVVLMTLWLVLPSRFIHRNRLRTLEESAEPVGTEQQEKNPPAPARALHRNGGMQAPWAGIPEVKLVRNRAFSLHRAADEPRYFFVIQLEGLLGKGEARIPVYWRPSPSPDDLLLKEIYEVEVAGRWVRAGNLQTLQDLLAQTLGELLRTRLPAFWLVPPKGGSIPVFQENGSLLAVIPAGPRIADDTLGGLREKFRHYLALTNGANLDHLTVAKLSPFDLRIHRPTAVFEGEGTWIPVFHLGSHLFAKDRIESAWECEGGPEALLHLWRLIGEELSQKGHISGPCALAITNLSEPTWEALQSSLRPTEFALSHEQSTPSGEGERWLSILQWEGFFFCRAPGRGNCLYASFDPWELCVRLGMELRRKRGTSPVFGSSLGLTAFTDQERKWGMDGWLAPPVIAQPGERAPSRTA
ncbi:MAG: hypothetical protein QN198_00885 [Armatimonadota bacterium]|nr:hypothetical protein [Armatimonadota bacterium]